MTGETEPVPLAVKTSDLPVRAASAAVMVALAGAALWLAGPWLDGFIVIVTLIAFGEFVRLVWRATGSIVARVIGLLAGAAYFGIAALILMALPAPAVLITIGTVVFVDTFAYFFGRTIGGPKIAPKISPSKTWAGLVGGVVGASIWLIAAMLVITSIADFDMGEVTGSAEFWGVAVLLGAILAVAAQSGDFFESWLKRKAGMKDSSQLIPGHGGIFDRVDGLLPVVILTGLAQQYL